MNVGLLAGILEKVMNLMALSMLPPFLVSLYYQESMAAWSFFATMILFLYIYLLLGIVKKKDKRVFIKDGFVIVGLCWVLISMLGALPFIMSGTIPSALDSVFESISCFTTTGASTLVDVGQLPKGIVFWRSFAQWIGGMGVLIFLIALLQSGSGRLLPLLTAESPGPDTSKLVPRLRDSAKILYSIYFGLTVSQIFFLYIGGIPLFDCVVNALATAGTGGFGIRNGFVGFYNSAYLEGVLIVFMILYGINFGMHFFLINGNFRRIFKDGELRAYIMTIVLSVVIVAINCWGSVYRGLGESFRQALFQVASIISSTGFFTTDYSKWPELSRMLLLILMFIGACAGSTGSGIKMKRFILLFKDGKRKIRKMLHPRSVETITMDNKTVEQSTLDVLYTYIVCYMAIMVLSIIIVAADNMDFETTVTAVAACMNNIGTGYGAVGPLGNFAGFSVLSKLVLCFDMLVGRLEIFPVIMLLFPTTWKNI